MLDSGTESVDAGGADVETPPLPAMVEPAAVDPHSNRVGSAAETLCSLAQRQPAATRGSVATYQRLLDALLNKRLETRMRGELRRELIQQLLRPTSGLRHRSRHRHRPYRSMTSPERFGPAQESRAECPLNSISRVAAAIRDTADRVLLLKREPCRQGAEPARRHARERRAGAASWSSSVRCRRQLERAPGDRAASPIDELAESRHPVLTHEAVGILGIPEPPWLERPGAQARGRRG